MEEVAELKKRVEQLENLINAFMLIYGNNMVAINNMQRMIYENGIKIVQIETGQEVLNQNQNQLVAALGIGNKIGDLINGDGIKDGDIVKDCPLDIR